MKTTTLKAEPRTVLGTLASRKLRAQGLLPAIIYGHGEPPESVALGGHEIEVALNHGARTLHVELNGRTQQFLIKEVQYDHLGQTPLHLDLTRVDQDERVRVKIGIELRGVPKGVGEGGMLDQHMADLEVECLVTAIPETLHPLVTHLGLNESLLVKDLELPTGVVPLANADEAVAVVRPKAAAEPEETPEEAEEKTAEPERITKERKEQEEKGEGKT